MSRKAKNADSASGPDIDLAVTVECPGWHAAVVDLERLTDAAVTAAVAGAHADGGGRLGLAAAVAVELGVVFADDARVQALNRDYRRMDVPTNVLAFENVDPPPPGEPWQLGDVIMAFETCRTEAAGRGIALADHAAHLVVHGVLHLFGYDHLDDGDARRMEGLETRVLSTLGIDDPYDGGVAPGQRNER